MHCKTQSSWGLTLSSFQVCNSRVPWESAGRNTCSVLQRKFQQAANDSGFFFPSFFFFFSVAGLRSLKVTKKKVFPKEEDLNVWRTACFHPIYIWTLYIIFHGNKRLLLWNWKNKKWKLVCWAGYSFPLALAVSSESSATFCPISVCSPRFHVAWPSLQPPG